MVVWYIHGANSSPLSFAFLKARLKKHRFRDICYDHERSVSHVIDELADEIEASSERVRIVGHSLGGLIGAAVAQKVAVDRLATIAAPFGGSEAARYLRFFSPHVLFEDIHPRSPLVVGLRLKPLPPTLSIVTLGGGTPLLPGPNDGVVTVASQTALDGPDYRCLPFNHFEVLLATETIEMIERFVLT